jgi:hypothetical protein
MADQTSRGQFPDFGDAAARSVQSGPTGADHGAMDGSWAGLVPPGGSGESMATHFDNWCQSQGIHPDAFGARESVQPRPARAADPATWEALPSEVAEWMGLDEAMVPFALNVAG